MATTFPVLGQVKPTSMAETTLIDQKASDAVVSAITICNTSSSATDVYSIRVVLAADYATGGTPSSKQYVASGITLSPNTFTTLNLGITLGAGDTVWVRSTFGYSAFNALGTLVG